MSEVNAIRLLIAPVPSVMAWWIRIMTACLPVGQPVNQGHVPQRVEPVQVPAGQFRADGVELDHAALSGQRPLMEVPVDVEVGVGDPERPALEEGSGDHPLTQSRVVPQVALHGLANVVSSSGRPSRGGVEDDHLQGVHRRRRLLGVEQVRL